MQLIGQGTENRSPKFRLHSFKAAALSSVHIRNTGPGARTRQAGAPRAGSAQQHNDRGVLAP
jgi:hypothetical protein